MRLTQTPQAVRPWWKISRWGRTRSARRRTTSPRCAASLVSLNHRRTLDVMTALRGADCGALPLAAPDAEAASISDFGPAVNVGLSLK